MNEALNAGRRADMAVLQHAIKHLRTLDSAADADLDDSGWQALSELLRVPVQSMDVAGVLAVLEVELRDAEVGLPVRRPTLHLAVAAFPELGT